MSDPFRLSPLVAASLELIRGRELIAAGRSALAAAHTAHADITKRLASAAPITTDKLEGTDE